MTTSAEIAERLAVGTKVCVRCRTPKPLTDFHTDRSRADGHAYRCKVCQHEAHMDWIAANRDRVNATSRAWNKAHRASRAATERRYRRSHPALDKAKRARYGARYPDRIRRNSVERQNRRRARRRRNWVERVNRLRVFERDGWVCQLCGLPVDRSLRHPHRRSATADHVVSLANNGAHSEANSQLAHLDCNQRKGDGDLAIDVAALLRILDLTDALF